MGYSGCSSCSKGGSKGGCGSWGAPGGAVARVGAPSPAAAGPAAPSPPSLSPFAASARSELLATDRRTPVEHGLRYPGAPSSINSCLPCLKPDAEPSLKSLPDPSALSPHSRSLFWFWWFCSCVSWEQGRAPLGRKSSVSCHVIRQTPCGEMSPKSSRKKLMDKSLQGKLKDPDHKSRRPTRG